MQKCHPVMIKLPLKEHPRSLSATPYFLQQSFSCFLCFLVLLCVFFFNDSSQRSLVAFPITHWLVPQNYNWLKKTHQIHSSTRGANVEDFAVGNAAQGFLLEQHLTSEPLLDHLTSELATCVESSQSDACMVTSSSGVYKILPGPNFHIQTAENDTKGLSPSLHDYVLAHMVSHGASAPNIKQGI